MEGEKGWKRGNLIWKTIRSDLLSFKHVRNRPIKTKRKSLKVSWAHFIKNEDSGV